MDDGQFNCITILDAIPEGHMNTARRLRENLIDLSNIIDGELQVRYIRVNTLSDLRDGIQNLIDETQTNGLKPWLHLEGHGFDDESGFKTANGTYCSWENLKNIITPINVFSGFNLILILATCFGGSFASAIRTDDRAPVLFLVGPLSEVETGHVDDGFIAFYRAFFVSSSLKDAIHALNAASPGVKYYRTSAEQFFYDVWAHYKRKMCTKKEIAKRARRIFRNEKAKKMFRVPSVGQIKRMFQNMEKLLFNRYRDAYFMYDVDKTYRTRFTVTYEIAEKNASR